MNKDVRALVDETRTLIEEVEGGDTAHAAWLAIQDRVEQLCEGRTQREVAEMLGKGRSWVQDLVAWEPARAGSPFSNEARPTMRDRSDRATAKKVARENPQAIAEAIKAAPPEAKAKAIKAIAEDEDLHEDVLHATVDAIDDKGKRGKTTPRREKTRGALQAWGGVISRAKQARDRAVLALESIQDVDEPVPDDLREDALTSVDRTIASWELVASNLRGESVGDQVEAFLAGHEE